MMKGFQVSSGKLPLSRRNFGRFTFGVSVALALAACGGGGGGADNLSQNASSLRPAHDALQTGMNKQDVINILGRPPDTDIHTTLTWRLSGEILRVTFGFDSRNQSNYIVGSLWVAAPPSMEENYRQLV